MRVGVLNKVSAWPYPTLFAHRGGGRLAPENTLAAIKLGHAHSFGAVEFDVKLSADAVAILMHDDTLDRTTNGHGKVAATALADLEALDAGGWHSAAFMLEPIPRFSAVAQYLHGLGMLANVEIKPCPGREAETGRLVAELARTLWSDRFVKPLLSSFSLPALQAARAAAPELPIGFLIDQPDQSCLVALAELNAVSIHCNHLNINADLVRLFHANGYRVLTYTVNEVARVRELLALGIDGIFTDALDTMAKHFPAKLADGGRPMTDPVDDMDLDWQAVPPPMP